MGDTLDSLSIAPFNYELDYVNSVLPDGRPKLTIYLNYISGGRVHFQDEMMIMFADTRHGYSYVSLVTSEAPFSEQDVKELMFSAIDEFNVTHGFSMCYLQDEARQRYTEEDDNTIPSRFYYLFTKRFDEYVYEQKGFYLFDDGLTRNLRKVERDVVNEIQEQEVDMVNRIHLYYLRMKEHNMTMLFCKKTYV